MWVWVSVCVCVSTHVCVCVHACVCGSVCVSMHVGVGKCVCVCPYICHVEEWVGCYEMNSTVFFLHVSCLKAIFCHHRDCV